MRRTRPVSGYAATIAETNWRHRGGAAASGLPAMLRCMDDANRGLIGAKAPGALAGRPPHDFGTGRRCQCGVSIMRYSNAKTCMSCARNPRPPAEPKEIVVSDVELMKTKDVCALLGVDSRRVRYLSEAGNFDCFKRGGRGTSARYDAAQVRAYKDYLDRQEAARKVEADAASIDNGSRLERELDRELGTVRLTRIVDTGETRPATDSEIERGVVSTLEEEEPKPCCTDGVYSLDSGPRCPGCPDAGLPTPAQIREDEDAPDEGPAEAPSDSRGELLERAVTTAEKAVKAAAYGAELTDQAISVAARAVARVENMDPEVKALETVSKALGGLDYEARLRVVQWAVDRFNIAYADDATASD